MTQNIIKLSTDLNNQFKRINIIYRSKASIMIEDILYHKIISIVTQKGGYPSTAEYIWTTNRTFTTQGFNKAVNSIEPKVFKDLTIYILENYFSYNINEKINDLIIKGRILATDGSKISISRYAKEFRDTQTGNYKKGLLMTIYDIKKKIPLLKELFTHANEREAFTSLIKFLEPNDLIIFDRGFYSKKLVELLTKNNLKFLFRIPTSCKKITSLIGEDVLYKNEIRKLEYQINNNKYYLLTNLPPEYNIKIIKELYHYRWDIEEYFKFLKENLNSKFYNFRTIDAVYRQVYIQQLIALLNRLIINSAEISHEKQMKIKEKNRKGKERKVEKEKKLKKEKRKKLKEEKKKERKKDEKISPSYTLNYFIRIFYNLIYKPKGYLKYIKEMVIHISKHCFITIKDNRSYPRQSIIKKTKWYYFNCSKITHPLLNLLNK